MTKRALSAVVVVGLLAGGTAVARSGRPDFTGRWRLNDELSEDLRDTVAKARRGRGAGGPGGTGGRGRPGDRGGPSGGGPGGRLARIEQGIETMTITQGKVEMTIVYADGHERVLYTDGRKWTRERPVGPVEIRSKWKSDKLVVKMKTERGATITETYELLPEDPRLYVTVALEGRGPSFSYRRVYDPVDLRHDGEDDTDDP